MFSELLALLEQDEKKFDVEKIKRAYQRAKNCHEGQMRSSGEPYVCHPIEVAKLVYEFGLDTDSIAAAFLHDTIEDTDLTYEAVKKEFGQDCANLVESVTKLGQIPYTTKEEAQIEYLRKMFLAMAKDIRVMLIKLADRLHNMRSLMYLSPQKQQVIAKETLDIFAPIAGRLGISPIKSELEDLCLKYLDPEAYDYLVYNIRERLSERKDFVAQIVEEIKA